jgi:hypothetical protein
MFKFLITSFFLLVVAAPALAKPQDAYPVSCTDLWPAVKDTLNNPHNYGIISMSDAALRASFVVVGNLTQYTDKLTLVTKDGGCAVNAAFLEVGSDNGDWRQFHHRLSQSLAKLQAAKSKPAVKVEGQM